MTPPNRFLIRDRLPPRARPGAAVEGWLHWELVTRSGLVRAGGDQHNLVLDAGLDLMATYGLTGVQSYAVVGTGSTAPTVADTGLEAELVRSNTVISAPTTRTANGVYEKAVTIEFDFAQANGNLTEWGFAPAATPLANLFTRELFRDGGGNPIAVTKTASDKLRLTYTLQFTLTPVVATAASFTIANIGLISGNYTLLRGTDPDSNSDLNTVHNLIKGRFGGGSEDYVFPDMGNQRFSTVGTNYASSYGQGTSMDNHPSVSFSPFVAGTHERTITVGLATDQDNMTVTHLSMGQQRFAQNQVESGKSGWIFVIDVGSEFTKDNEHTLSIDYARVTWGRG